MGRYRCPHLRRPVEPTANSRHHDDSLNQSCRFPNGRHSQIPKAGAWVGARAILFLLFCGVDHRQDTRCRAIVAMAIQEARDVRVLKNCESMNWNACAWRRTACNWRATFLILLCNRISFGWRRHSKSRRNRGRAPIRRPRIQRNGLTQPIRGLRDGGPRRSCTRARSRKAYPRRDRGWQPGYGLRGARAAIAAQCLRRPSVLP